MASSSFLLLAATATCIFWALWWRPWSATSTKLDLPLVEFDDVENARDQAELKGRYTNETGKLLKKGYSKVWRPAHMSSTGPLLMEALHQYLKNGRPFAMRNFAHNETNRPLVFVPVQYLEEVRNAPQDKLSLPEYTERASLLGHVMGPRITDEVQFAARLNLNRALNNLIGPIQEQCFSAARETMPSVPDWTPVHIYPIILQLFAHMSARVMVGSELCGGWTSISLQYLNVVLKAPGAVRQKYSPWTYWTAKYFSPEVKAVMSVRRQAAEFVRPVLEARQEDFRANGEAAEKHDDFIQWLMDEHRARGRQVTPDELVQNIFITMVASMHGTSTMGYSVLLDLLDHSDALEEIKDEIDRVKKDDLGGASVWTRHALGELRLLDSVMRETHRMHPFTEVTMQRTVLVPYTFKDGLTVPPGLSVNFTSLQHSLDADIHGPNADTFEPKRWFRKRQGFDTSKYQFASTSDEWLNWGGGPHACPGRFLADVTIKLILIYLVTNYEIKYSEGVTTRPADGRRNMMITPDMTTPMMFKELQT